MRAPRTALLAAILVLPPAADGEEALLASETIEAREVQGPLSADPSAPLWEGWPSRAVTATVQRTIRLHDRAANQALATSAPRQIGVRAAFDGRDLAVALEWSDATEDRATADATDAFGDGAALEFPLRFGAGLRLPYVGMGDEGAPVAIYHQRAGEDGTVGREATGRGFGSHARADLGGVRVGMRHDRGAWRAVFVRPLVAAGHDLRQGLVPFAVAVWDGARHERGGNKALTSWKFLRLPRFPLDAAYAAEMSYGRGRAELGDLARGKLLVEAVCAACHTVGKRTGPPGIAPDLSSIGVISTPAYLRESLLDPSAVVVPSPNPSQHYDRSKATDSGGAYPSNDAFVWYRLDAGGKKVSKMPAYGALPRTDVESIVAYLMTLGAEPGGGKQP